MTDARDAGAAGTPRGPTIEGGPDAMAEELAAWGRVLLLETRGRVTGLRRIAAVGFVEEPDGALLVAATDPETAWARNLLADARCRVTIGDGSRACRAVPLTGAEAHRAVTALILRYGTPAERLGAGPAFRLSTVPDDEAEPA